MTDWQKLFKRPEPTSQWNWEERRKARNQALRKAFPKVNFSANTFPADSKQAKLELKLGSGSILAMEKIADALLEITPHLDPWFLRGNQVKVVGIIHPYQYKKGPEYELHSTDGIWSAVTITQSSGGWAAAHRAMTPDVMIALQTLYKEIYKDSL